MVRPQYDITDLESFKKFLDTSVGYLEKASLKDLGDFSDNGKIRNAGSGNYTVYWQWYNELGYENYQGEPYCAGAVSTMMSSAFGLEKAKKLLEGDLFIYCPDLYTRFHPKGRTYSTPKEGDVALFWSDSLGRWGHTGIVYSVDSNGSGYTTWEANTTAGNDCVVRNGGATCRKHYTLGQRKVVFCRPDYEGNGISTSVNTNLEEFGILTSNVTKLTCTASTTLNVRKIPGGSIVGCIKHGEKVNATKKCFLNGDAWFYIPSKEGWCSAKYFEGWIRECSCGRWWYILDGYKYYVNSIHIIDGEPYYFDDTGYMFEGTITFKTNENGVLIKA